MFPCLCTWGLCVLMMFVRGWAVGTLVAKTLMTAVQAPFSTAPSGALVSLDVFALQVRLMCCELITC